MQGLCANLSCQHLGEKVQLVLKTCSLEYYVTVLIHVIGEINTIAMISFQRSCEMPSSHGQEVWSLVHGGEGDTGGLRRRRKKKQLFGGSVIATRLNMIKNQMNIKENAVRMVRWAILWWFVLTAKGGFGSSAVKSARGNAQMQAEGSKY